MDVVKVTSYLPYEGLKLIVYDYLLAFVHSETVIPSL